MNSHDNGNLIASLIGRQLLKKAANIIRVRTASMDMVGFDTSLVFVLSVLSLMHLERLALQDQACHIAKLILDINATSNTIGYMG
jgi:hypothetical protein